MYMLDTDFCIDWLRRKAYAREALAGVRPSLVAVSAVTAGELFMGAHGAQEPGRELGKVVQFLQPIRIINYGAAEAAHFGRMAALLRKQGQLIGVADTMIAATAQLHNLVVVTNNFKQFGKVPGLQAASWRAKP